MIDVIMHDNTTAEAKDVIPELIQSAVRNAVENLDGLNLRSKAGIEDAGQQIAYYLEISTGEKINVQAVITELKRQLR